MIFDEIIALLRDNPEGMKVSVIARCLEPKACGNRFTELCFIVDRECMRLTIKGTLIRVTEDDESKYIMRETI